MKKLQAGRIPVALIFCAIYLSTPSFGITAASQGQETSAITQNLQFELVVLLNINPGPVFATPANDGSNRLFFVVRPGRIEVRQPGTHSSTEFLNITSRVLSPTGREQGLLGLAFHPQYSTNRRFFVYYTRQTDGAIVIAEYHTSATNPNVADTTEIPILTIPHPGQHNNNGGMLAFGPDGFLYAGVGDGGGANDPSNNAQNTDTFLGKILRLDIDHPNGSIPYSSPSSNPFSGSTPGLDEIYAFGMRNPWRFSFDRGGSNQLYVGDVGQGAREEVDIIVNGGNYGWPIMEGSICNPNFNGGVCTPPAGYIPPILDYMHTGGRCSITGGYVYRGRRGTFPVGAYIYADYCSGEIFSYFNNQQTVVGDAGANFASFGEDEAGELYYVSFGGFIGRIANPDETIGVYRPSTQTFYLRTTNTVGVADYTIPYGSSGDIPVVGDWNFDYDTEIGVYRPGTSTFYLRNSKTPGAADLVIPYGTNGDIPIIGDWDGNGTTTIGVYRPSNQTFYLRNSNTPGEADMIIPYGAPGDIPIVGDWDGYRNWTIGVYRPSNQTFYLRNSNTPGDADWVIPYGAPGDIPIVGDWDGDRFVTIGVRRPGEATFYLRNLNSPGSADLIIPYGSTGDIPLIGSW